MLIFIRKKKAGHFSLLSDPFHGLRITGKQKGSPFFQAYTREEEAGNECRKTGTESGVQDHRESPQVYRSGTVKTLSLLFR